LKLQLFDQAFQLEQSRDRSNEKMVQLTGWMLSYELGGLVDTDFMVVLAFYLLKMKFKIFENWLQRFHQLLSQINVWTDEAIKSDYRAIERSELLERNIGKIVLQLWVAEEVMKVFFHWDLLDFEVEGQFH
jgi:hypothetical protein